MGAMELMPKEITAAHVGAVVVLLLGVAAYCFWPKRDNSKNVGGDDLSQKTVYTPGDRKLYAAKEIQDHSQKSESHFISKYQVNNPGTVSSQENNFVEGNMTKGYKKE